MTDSTPVRSGFEIPVGDIPETKHTLFLADGVVKIVTADVLRDMIERKELAPGDFYWSTDPNAVGYTAWDAEENAWECFPPRPPENIEFEVKVK